MKKLIFLLIVLMAAVSCTGCSSTLKTAPRLNVASFGLEPLERSEYEVIGNVTGQASVTRFLIWGKPKTLGVMGASGQMPAGRLKQMMAGGGMRGIEQAACYDALAKVPEADFILPLSRTSESSGLKGFIWSETATVRAKAIRIKSDRDLKR